MIVGVGNILLKDEGIGVHVVRALQEMSLASPKGEVEVVDGGTSPSAFDTAEGADKLIIVDAARGGGEPGQRRASSWTISGRWRWPPSA